MHNKKEILSKKILEPLIIISKKLLRTRHNILLKFKLSLLVSSPLIYALAVTFQEEANPEAADIFKNISGILLFLFFVLISNNESAVEFVKGFVYLIIVFITLVFSLNFCINDSLNYHGFRLILYSIIACLGLLFVIFFLISKFVDVYIFIRNLFIRFKEKLFNSPKSSTSKITGLIENMTAIFTAIGSLALATKTIIEPLINQFK